MTLAYFVLWLALNGRVTGEVLILGIPVAVGLDYLMRRALGIRFPSVSVPVLVRLLPGALLYTGALVCEIIKANVAIIRLILAPSIEVEPCLVRLRTKLRTRAARVALANSITLTPGTITVALEGDELLIHALNHEIAEGLADSSFERLLSEMEAHEAGRSPLPAGTPGEVRARV
ncbi:MAG: Na+/H+ antiporter subunit E [Fretibacterium sp.]|nr:Na+/H+ antiporter subunit E [Fretibacterium sp.]